MLKQFDFKYGDGKLNINLEEDEVLCELFPKDAEPVSDLEKEVSYLLDNPVDSEPFNDIFKRGDKVVIVVSDITRQWIHTERFLPYIIGRLNTLGISDSDIIILTANGTHRGQTPEEIEKIVGHDIFNRIKVVEHNCDGELEYVGTTSRGTRVEVNKLVVQRKVILTGGIVHHLMAGFGGGRKSILPGVSGRRTIAQNHLIALDPDREQSNPLIGAGVTLGNPLNLDMIEAAGFEKPEFLVNSIVRTDGKIIKLVAGNWLTAWQEGYKWADEKFTVPVSEKADTVIVGCGGYPKDISLYQAVKSLFNASLAVKEGGTILFIAECREGAGADAFFSWIKPLREGKLDGELRKQFTIPGYIFYAACETSRKCNVVLLSSIAPEIVEPMGIKAANSLKTALELAGLNDETSKKITLMPYGGATIPKYTGR